MYQQRPDQYDGIDRESAGLIDELCAQAEVVEATRHRYRFHLTEFARWLAHPRVVRAERRRRWSRWCRVTSVGSWRTCGRASAFRHLLDQGHHIDAIADVLGHESVDTTRRHYAFASNARRRHTINSYDV